VYNGGRCNTGQLSSSVVHCKADSYGMDSYYPADRKLCLHCVPGIFKDLLNAHFFNYLIFSLSLVA